MSPYTWLCPNELERERLVATVRGVTRARTLMFLMLTGLVIVSADEIGLLALVPMAIAGVGSNYLYSDLDGRRQPEYWAMAGWLLTQLMLGLGIAITGGPHSPALAWLAIAVVSLVARFGRAGILAGMAFLFALFLALTLGVDARSTLDHPANALFVGGLLLSTWIFAQALLRSDLEHRDIDKLTGLPNQPVFVEQLRLAVGRMRARGGTVIVIVLDLDGFGLANDSLGPSGGDELLRQAAARVARVAEAAEIVARRSADEFLILLVERPDHGVSQAIAGAWRSPRGRARNLARSVQAELAMPLRISGSEDDVYLGASVGISLFSKEDFDADQSVEQIAEEALVRAQLALSSARSTGPGGVMIYDAASPDSRDRLSLINRLRRAIDRDEFRLQYQPAFDLQTEAIVGVEALLRWEDPEHGAVPPDEFIPLAEETGMIEPIGAWVMSEVARQAREWEQMGIPIDVAFNLSPRQLWQPDLLLQMLKTFAAPGMHTERIVVEITESSAVRDPARTLTLLHQMHQAGLRIAIDDFGVGLSSLSRLHSIPAQVLKLDRSFVAEITESPGGTVMVQTIIQLAHNLGMVVQAEGVEQDREREVLRASGCEYAQGFLLGGPQPAENIAGLYIEALAARTMPVVPGRLQKSRVENR